MIRVEPGKEYFIVEKRQYGDIFVDSDIDPHSVLFRHYCGFAYLTGAVSEALLEEMIKDVSVK